MGGLNPPPPLTLSFWVRKCFGQQRESDSGGKQYKYVCIATNQPDTEFNPNHNPTAKQHAVVSIQLNIVACPTYPDKVSLSLHRYHYFPLSLSLFRQDW